MVNNNLFTEMLVTYNSILIITALLPNLNATAPKNPGRKLEQRCSICADTVIISQLIRIVMENESNLKFKHFKESFNL